MECRAQRVTQLCEDAEKPLHTLRGGYIYIITSKCLSFFKESIKRVFQADSTRIPREL